MMLRYPLSGCAIALYIVLCAAPVLATTPTNHGQGFVRQLTTLHATLSAKLRKCEAYQQKTQTVVSFDVQNLNPDALLVIEKRVADGRWYDAVGFLETQDGANGLFSWLDDVLTPGIITYRIVILQPDGQTETLGAVTLNIRLDQVNNVNWIKADQPQKEWLKLHVETQNPNMPLTFYVITEKGQIMVQRQLQLVKGKHQILIPTDHLPEGWHQVMVKHNEQVIFVEHLLFENAK
jgi:hypothetical protein